MQGNSIIHIAISFCQWLFIIIFFIIGINTTAYSSYLGAGANYSYSLLHYKLGEDGLPDDSYFSDIGMTDNKKTNSHDVGFALYYDDADEFDYLCNVQLRFEYYRFYIPFEKAKNEINGDRYGIIILLARDIINKEDSQVFVGLNTGYYYSKGEDSKNGYSYQSFESPLGIVLGNKFIISDFIVCVTTITFNVYTDVTLNNILAVFFNRLEDSTDTFETGRKEAIISVSCAYQL